MDMNRKRRGNSRYFILFVLLGLLLGFSFWGLRAVGRRMELFRIEAVTIEGRSILPEAFCQSLCEEYIGRNLFDISTDELAERYEQLARVRSCKVSRKLPSKLVVKLDERRTAFWVGTTDGRLAPVGYERVILDADLSYAHEDAPLVSLPLSSRELTPGDTLRNETLEEVFAMHERITSASQWLADRVSQYYFRNDELIVVESGSGCRIVIGEGNLDEKLRRLVFFAENKGFSPGVTLDLRFEDQIIAKMGVR